MIFYNVFPSLRKKTIAKCDSDFDRILLPRSWKMSVSCIRNACFRRDKMDKPFIFDFCCTHHFSRERRVVRSIIATNKLHDFHDQGSIRSCHVKGTNAMRLSESHGKKTSCAMSLSVQAKSSSSAQQKNCIDKYSARDTTDM